MRFDAISEPVGKGQLPSQIGFVRFMVRDASGDAPGV